MPRLLALIYLALFLILLTCCRPTPYGRAPLPYFDPRPPVDDWAAVSAQIDRETEQREILAPEDYRHQNSD